jgi:nickel/cobalt transporter (NicO) family protein
MVMAFSLGLALTLVAVGAAAAIDVRHVGLRSAWFATLASRAPYVSGVLIILVGLYVTWQGLAPLL